MRSLELPDVTLRNVHLLARRKGRNVATVEAMEPRRLLSSVVVNTLIDETLANSTTSLREAIQSAAAGDTIQFKSGLSGQITLAGGALGIEKNLSIVGLGSGVISINAQNASRIFVIGDKASVTISDLKLIGGRDMRGGGILNAGALTLKRIALNGNSAHGLDGDMNDGGPGDGGAIYNSGNLNISSSQLIGNSAVGGAGQLGLTEGNAGGGSGGAIYNDEKGIVTISATTLSGNSAAGGIAAGMPGGAGGGNGGDAFGGAIRNYGGVHLLNCTFANNFTRGSDGGGGDLASGTGGAATGGAINSQGPLDLSGCTFTSNYGQAGAGGQVYSLGLFSPGGPASGGAIVAAGTLAISGSTFNSNYLLGGNEQFTNGGAITSIGSLQMIATTIAGNTAKAEQNAADNAGQAGAPASGGGIWIGGSGGTISGCTFDNNKVIAGPGGMGYDLHGSDHASAPGGNGYGGGLYVASTVAISNSTIARNTAMGGKGGDADFVTQSPGAIGGDGGGAGVYVLDGTHLSLRSDTIAGNTAIAGNGGAGAVDNPGGAPLPQGANGFATGGGVFAGGFVDLGNTIVAGNQAPKAGPDVLGAITSSGFNLIENPIDSGGWIATDLTGFDPKLGPIASNGGPTKTMLPLPGSPAIDHGSAFGLTLDQRGFPRPYGAAADIGAVEVQPYPFNGTPIQIAASGSSLIQAENFDNGGEGIAWHDVDAANLGNAYRTTTGVDIQPTTDVGGGFNVGWARAGEWLNYTVQVASAGSYQVAFRVASNGVGGKFHLEVDGQDDTGAMTVPNTGGWQVWKTVTTNGVYLNSGRHLLRLVFDSAGQGGAVGNFNYLQISPDAAHRVIKSDSAAFVRDGIYSNTNYGQDSQLLIKKWKADYNREAFVQFNLSGFAGVSDAKLRLFGNLQDANTSAIDVGIFSASDDWTEPLITWNKRPTAGSQVASFTVTGTTARWYEIDLTAYIKAAKAAGRAKASIVLRGLTASMTVTTFNSDETAAGPQLLVVT